MRHLSVREIMTVGLCECRPGASVHEACRLMVQHRCGSVLVFDQGRLIGIFTERDLVTRVVGRGLDPKLTLVVEAMTRDPEVIHPEDRVDDAIRQMDEFGYRHMPVVERDRVIGVISVRDCSIEDLAAMHAELEMRRAVAERAW